MNWFIHDLSLNGQHAVPQNFLNHLVELLKLRRQYPAVYDGLRCTRTLGERPVTAIHSFKQVVQSCSDKDLRRLILQWIDSKGPFWDDERETADDDYFQCGQIDVTDLGAGEASRQHLKGKPAATYSFDGGNFNYSPLLIQHGLDEQPLGQISLVNLWDCNQLRNSAIAASPSAQNWHQVVEQANIRFPHLLLASNLIDYLRRETFTSALAERIFELLGKLEEFVTSRNPNGTYSAETNRLLADHFSGNKAWFTDESEGNKNKFSADLTFADPNDLSKNIFCPWHGKIKTPQYRIHFPWPMLQTETKLRITYIGPKITKY